MPPRSPASFGSKASNGVWQKMIAMRRFLRGEAGIQRQTRQRQRHPGFMRPGLVEQGPEFVPDALPRGVAHQHPLLDLETPGEAQGGRQPADDAVELQPPRSNLFRCQIHPAAIGTIAAVPALVAANVGQVDAAAPGTENTDADPVTEGESAEIDEMPVDCQVPGVGDRIGMESVLRVLDQGAQLPESAIGQRLHRPYSGGPRPLDCRGLRNAPCLQQALGETGIVLVEVAQVGDPRLREVEI